MTAERDGKSRRTGQPDLLASLPDERPPASQPAPGIDPAAIEELLTGMRDLREQVAGLREAESAERPAPVTPEALEAWGDNLVARVAEAARPAEAPADDAAAAVADHIRRIEEAAAKAEAAAERIAGGQDSTADRVAAEIEGAVTRIETGLATTRNANRQQSRQADPILEEILTRTAGLRFGWRAVLLFLIVFVLGMLLESRIHTLYRWL